MIVMIANLFACASSEMEDKDQKVQVSATIEYDSILAKKYGADDYGMKPYVIAFLERGEANGLTEQEAAELQQAHMENIGKMAEAGKLVLAGPFLDDGPLRGIYIFDVATVEEAEELVGQRGSSLRGDLRITAPVTFGHWHVAPALVDRCPAGIAGFSVCPQDASHFFCSQLIDKHTTRPRPLHRD